MYEIENRGKCTIFQYDWGVIKTNATFSIVIYQKRCLLASVAVEKVPSTEFVVPTTLLTTGWFMKRPHLLFLSHKPSFKKVHFFT